MKAVNALPALIILLFVFSLGACSRPNEKLYYGVFTNPKGNPQKTVRAPGSFKDYALLSDSTPVQEGTEKLVKAWMDSDGNTYFQSYTTITVGPYKNTIPKAQTLTRISKDGSLLEFMWNGVVEFNPSSFPTKIDPTDTLRYRMFNRAGE